MANFTIPLLIILSCILAFSSPSSRADHNVIDSCRKLNLNWSSNRQVMADCAVGFGADSMGGRDGEIYVVTDPSDDPSHPKPGTLRYGTMKIEPLWIIFEKDMVLTLENELFVSSYKTIDGRGFKIEIANGPCMAVHGVHHVIIHGISIHDCKKGKNGKSNREGYYDGDAISVLSSTNVWIDHCYFASCADGLVDVTHASSNITISNNHFTSHEKVMLLGHRDGYTADKIMQITVAFNHFGPDLASRLPRVRYGYAHVTNNFYEPWSEYAIGGSSSPTILSEGNYFIAPNDFEHKQVTKRELSGESDKRKWKDWRWTTLMDKFEDGAFFIPSGVEISGPIFYSRSQMFNVSKGSLVPTLTFQAGPLKCVAGEAC